MSHTTKIDFNSYESIMSAFVDSTQGVLRELDDKMERLKLDHDDEDRTKAHYARKIILKWYRINGGL